MLRCSVLFATLGVLACTNLPTQAEDAFPPAEYSEVLAQFKTKTLELPDGKRMNCQRRSGDGPVLVLVPGTWGDLQSFAPLLAELPGNLPIVVIELCWQGGHVPPTFDLSIQQLADDVLQVISELQLKEFFISGHSIGGMIAVEIAGREVPGLVGAIPMEGWTHHTVTKTAFDGIVTENLTPAQEKLRQANRARGRGHLSAEQLREIATIWRRWNGYKALERSQVPILHIWGDRGHARPDHEALQIPDRPTIEVAWITGASHSLIIEDPQAAAKLLVEFIKRNSS